MLGRIARPSVSTAFLTTSGLSRSGAAWNGSWTRALLPKFISSSSLAPDGDEEDPYGSPIAIDLNTVVDASQAPFTIKVHYPPTPPTEANIEVVTEDDHGPSVKVDIGVATEPVYTVSVHKAGGTDPLYKDVTDGAVYKLDQLHYHTPREHPLTGEDGEPLNLPIELHFFHKHVEKELYLGLGAVFLHGEANPALDVLLASAEEPGTRKKFPGDFSVYEFMPPLSNDDTTEMLTYMGGKTSKPFTRRVPFFIFTEPLRASDTQIDRMKRILGNNSRGVRALNDRKVYRTYGGRGL